MAEEETQRSSVADPRGLPRVDRVVGHPSLAAVAKKLGAEPMTRLVRSVIEAARRAVLAGETCPSLEEVARRVEAKATLMFSAKMRRVINATGVVLHTNLGRAPLSAKAALELSEQAAGYSSIEIDLATGRRGRRGAFVEDALREITGAEAALVVNNNAAAVLLMLGALAAGRSVVVSRGELVEIGGGFRVPEVMARSGAKLVEVGTTNKTRISDFAKALDGAPDAAAILRVHQGNFRQIGFVERPEHVELSRLAKERGVLLLEDLGGGALVDLAPLGFTEPSVKSCVAAGSDVVCFSTDKVLGGPQGGAIVGRTELVTKCRRDPLARALRLGRLPLVALQATLESYLAGDLDAIPALAALRAATKDVHARAEALHEELSRRAIASSLLELSGAVGGGACAEEPLPSWGVALDVETPPAHLIAERLRSQEPAVLARVQEGRAIFDVRTLLAGEDEMVAAAIEKVVRPGSSTSTTASAGRSP